MIELRTDAAQKVNRAYGTTGIITALEMPLAPAWPWIDLIVTFDDFFEAMQFGYDVALADGVVKKLITPMIWPIPQHFPALKSALPGRQARHLLHDRRAVAGKLQGDRSARAARSPSSSRMTTRPARSRSTNTPGTTRPCSG